MPTPEFTETEQYLITVVQAPRVSRFLCAYMICGAAMLLVGVNTTSTGLMVAAFGGVCCFRLYEEWYQLTRWTPVLRSIFSKYEAAVVAIDDSNEAVES